MATLSIFCLYAYGLLQWYTVLLVRNRLYRLEPVYRIDDQGGGSVLIVQAIRSPQQDI